VASEDGLRIVRLAERTGFWPALTDDSVHDFMLREALMRKFDDRVKAERDREELDARVKAVERSVMENVRRGVMH
jgi:hypothetical protein